MIRWGIVGAGAIARRFAASLGQVEDACLVAASCRSAEKAAAFLAEVPCAEGARAYGNHADLLGDSEVDAIYLALPHSMHAEWALRAFEAGKAVLCEKPAVLSAEEMRAVADGAERSGVLFMEAMKARFVPAYEQVLAALPAIGPVRRVAASLCNDMMAEVEGAGTYHLADEPGCGVLYDCGIYCASWIEALVSGPYELVGLDARMRGRADVYVRAEVRGSTDCTAELECAFDEKKPRTAVIEGERGRIVVEELHRSQRAVVEAAGAEPYAIEAPYVVDDFYGEIVHFCELYRAGATESPVMPLAASIRCAELIDVIRAGFSAA